MADMRETCVNHVAGEKYAIMYSAEPKWVNRLKKLAAENPGDVTLTELSDGISVRVILPVNWIFKLRPPRKLTDEQRAKLSERFRRDR